MKKIVYLLLVSALLFSLFSACSNSEETTNTQDNSNYQPKNEPSPSPSDNTTESMSSNISTTNDLDTTSQEVSENNVLSEYDKYTLAYTYPNYPAASDTYTRNLSNADIEIFKLQAEILSSHLSERCNDIQNIFNAANKTTINYLEIDNNSILNFIISSQYYNEYEIHPYNDYNNRYNEISKYNAQIIASEFFGRANWSVEDTTTGDKNYVNQADSYQIPDIGHTPALSHELSSINTTFDSENNIITVDAELIYIYNNYFDSTLEELKSFHEIDYETLNYSPVIFRYKVITDKDTNKTFLRFISMDFAPQITN